MNLQRVRSEIAEHLSQFVGLVEANTSMGAYDINVAAETVLVPLLAEVLDLPDLADLNASHGANFPGVDLGDLNARVAVQVTSDSSSAKVQKTLETFFRHGLERDFDKVIVYVITRKQDTYTSQSLAAAVPESFDFDPRRHVIDFRDLIRLVKSFQHDRAFRVLEILRANFGDGVAPLSPAKREKTEPLFLNLIEAGFPDVLYVGDFNFDRKEVRAAAKTMGVRLPKHGDERGIVQAAISVNGDRFSSDYHAHAGQVLTFHDLSQDSPLARVVDPGTIVELSPEDYYGVSQDAERVFQTLLHYCLKQMLHKLGVQWQHQDHLFIFEEEGEDPIRRESWVGKRSGSRKVYERTMKDNKPDEILKCKHLAFRADFERLGGQWYLRVKPEHFFSWNGYLRSNYGADGITWLKKKERNEQVFNHLRFILYYIRHARGAPDLFLDLSSVRRPYDFLRLGKLVELRGAPHLNDAVWVSGEEESVRDRLEDPEPTPPLFIDLDSP